MEPKRYTGISSTFYLITADPLLNPPILKIISSINFAFASAYQENDVVNRLLKYHYKGQKSPARGVPHPLAASEKSLVDGSMRSSFQATQTVPSTSITT